MGGGRGSTLARRTDVLTAIVSRTIVSRDVQYVL